MATMREPIAGDQAVVMRWIEAYNARDLDAMLACLDRDVDYHPLRLGGLSGPYHGHDGVEHWFTGLDARRHAHRIDVTEIHQVGDDHTLAAGTLRSTDDHELGPFSALYRTTGGTILDARHYLSEPDLLQRLEQRRPTT